MTVTDQQTLTAEIETAIAAGETEIADLHILVNAAASRVNALLGFRAALQGNQTEIELARISAEVRKLKSPAATAA